MNGLGIVLEESIDIPPNKNVYTNESSEILLPPLPNEEDLNESLSSFPSKELDFDDASNTSVKNIESQALENQFLYQNFQSSLSTYELDSPSINLDNNQLFQTRSNSTSNSNLNSNPNVASSTSGSKDNNTSPLKRLKSIKNTIRKLSLSKSSSSVSTPVVPIMSSSTVSSGLSNSGLSTTPVTLNVQRPQVSPLQNHIKAMSQDSAASYNTVDSKVKCTTPSTPPFSSPIITLSDLNTAKDCFMQKIKQSYFENLNGDLTDDQTNLTNYYNYLVNEKSVINDTYNLTKNRLVKSGWCSNDDLQNLNLQRISQLGQIDSVLQEISTKLAKN